MIRLACTNCRNILTIDDAFAGGVCRCQHCGTIQTVPAATAATAANEVVVGGPNLGGGRNGTSFGTPSSGTGLDELAGAVVSSGLSSRRLTRPEPGTAGSAAAPPRRQNMVPLFVAAGVVIVLLIGLVVYMGIKQMSPTTPPVTDKTAERTPGGPAGGTSPGTPGTGSGTDPNPAANAQPNFCSSPLAGDTVIYLLDRGTATQEVFPVLKDAALKSIASLGTGRHFQVVFWDNGSGDAAATPPTTTTYATPANVDAARRAMDDVSAFGQTDVKPALAMALSQHPDTIVIATAKGWALDDAWVKDVIAARGASPVRIDTFSLGAAPAPAGATTPPLKAVADQTGGTYVEVSNADLKAAAE